MAQRFSIPRGTRDVLPASWRVRQHVLDTARTVLRRYDFGRISTPTFEETALFARGVGEGTDIVGKEMYTFTDRGDRSLTLRPEGTAPVVRAYVDGLQREPQPVKLWYYAPMFRYEKPQEGRYREHYQLGAEVIGSELPVVDAELVSMLDTLYRELGVPDVELHLNSIGDAQCRPAYRATLVDFLEQHRDELCEECRGRIATNPMRTFDCKNPACRTVMQAAPTIADHLCAPCQAHFDEVLALLDAVGVRYVRDPRLVRGLDYYTRTVFEFKTTSLGAQDAVGSGGRYDGLVETLGGQATPAIGFGCGVERLVLLLEQAGVALPDTQRVDVYVCVDGASARTQAFALAHALRAAGLVVEEDLAGRSLKGQLKQASRLGAALALVVDADGTRLHAMRGREEWAVEPGRAVDEVRAWLAANRQDQGTPTEEPCPQ